MNTRLNLLQAALKEELQQAQEVDFCIAAKSARIDKLRAQLLADYSKHLRACAASEPDAAAQVLALAAEDLSLELKMSGDRHTVELKMSRVVTLLFGSRCIALTGSDKPHVDFYFGGLACYLRDDELHISTDQRATTVQLCQEADAREKLEDAAVRHRLTIAELRQEIKKEKAKLPAKGKKQTS